MTISVPTVNVNTGHGVAISVTGIAQVGPQPQLLPETPRLSLRITLKLSLEISGIIPSQKPPSAFT